MSGAKARNQNVKTQRSVPVKGREMRGKRFGGGDAKESGWLGSTKAQMRQDVRIGGMQVTAETHWKAEGTLVLWDRLRLPTTPVEAMHLRGARRRTWNASERVEEVVELLAGKQGQLPVDLRSHRTGAQYSRENGRAVTQMYWRHR